MSIAIFPASGGLGTATLTHLVEVLPPSDITLISRHPERHSALHARGAVTRRADFDDATSFDGVFSGVKTLNLISYPSIQIDHRFIVAKTAIDGAIDQGVTHIFYSSLALGGLSDTSVTQVMAAHLCTEAYLAELASSKSDFTYTVIRQGLYSTSYPIYTGFFDVNKPGDGIIKIPHDGSGPGLAWAKREELGEATANIIAAYVRDRESFPYINKRISLSGPRSYSLNETAGVFSRVLGREIKIQEISVAEYASTPRVRDGFPAGEEDWPTLWATAWEGIRQGEASHVTDELRRWLKREPEDFETTIQKLVEKDA